MKKSGDNMKVSVSVLKEYERLIPAIKKVNESNADFSSSEEDLDWDSDNNQETFDDFDDELIEDLLSDDTIDISSDSSIDFDDIGNLDDFEDFDFK